ncbi:MAG: NAD(P)-dependent alcohol dehydrogenase [Bacteroidota bacterium]
MQAILYHQYGPPEVMQISEVPVPQAKAREVRIRIKATTVTVADWRMRKADPFLIRLINGLFRPRRAKVLGLELAGVIDQVGEEVSLFKEGDEVFTAMGIRMGAYAEYCCLPETWKMVIKPKEISFAEAAALPIGACTALYYLKDKGQLKRGDKVLIYGASGSVGTYSVQLAKHWGAEVTAVCSGRNVDLMRALGADEVIDYTLDDFTERPIAYDVVFDAVGKITAAKGRKVLVPKGKYLSVNKGMARVTKKKLSYLKALVEEGKLRVVIDRRYLLHQIVEAHHYVEQGHKIGNVAIQLMD